MVKSPRIHRMGVALTALAAAGALSLAGFYCTWTLDTDPSLKRTTPNVVSRVW